MAFANVAWGHDGLSHSGKVMRELVKTLTGGLYGVTGGTNALKVSQQTVAAATVKVAEGGAVIPATGAGLGGSYQPYNDADLTSPTIAPTAANGRMDRLIIRVTAGVPALEVVQGVASGSPAEPSIPGDNYLELALITLPASTTNITDAMITDRRVRLASGTPAVVTSTTRPASPYSGMQIYETDTKALRTWTGTFWRRVDARDWTDISTAAALNNVTLGTGGDFEIWARTDGITCEVSVNVVLGTGGSVSGVLTVSLPTVLPWDFMAKNRGPYIYKHVGSAHYLDASVRHYPGSCRVNGGTRLLEFFHPESGGSGQVGTSTNTPFATAWGPSDELGGYIAYELAAEPTGI